MLASTPRTHSELSRSVHDPNVPTRPAEQHPTPVTVSRRSDEDHANGSVRHRPDPTLERTVSSPSSASTTPLRPPSRTTDNPPPALPWLLHASNTVPDAFATTRLFRYRDQHSWRSSSNGPAPPDHQQRRSTHALAGPFHEPDQHPPTTVRGFRRAGRRWSQRAARTSSTAAIVISSSFKLYIFFRQQSNFICFLYYFSLVRGNSFIQSGYFFAFQS